MVFVTLFINFLLRGKSITTKGEKGGERGVARGGLRGLEPPRNLADQ